MEVLLASVFFFLQSVIILLLGINIKTGNATNQKVTEMTTWAKQHEKNDDERHENEREARRDLWSNLNEMKQKAGTG